MTRNLLSFFSIGIGCLLAFDFINIASLTPAIGALATVGIGIRFIVDASLASARVYSFSTEKKRQEVRETMTALYRLMRATAAHLDGLANRGRRHGQLATSI